MGASQRPLVIVNPASRGGDGARDWPKAAACLSSAIGGFDRRFTEGPGHAATLSEEAARAGRDLVLTFGGDGTISETARGLVASGTRCELGVLPHGTGGDFVRSLAMPTRLADAARSLGTGRTLKIDVGRVTFADGANRLFINAASFGLSAEVARRVNQSTKSRSSYAEHTLKAALDFDFPRVEIDPVPGRARQLRVTTVSIHNGRFFGGGMKMAPGAALVDGKLQLIVIGKMSALKLLSRAPLLYWGAHLGLSDVVQAEIQSIEARPVRDDEVVRVEVDGESFGQLPARFEIVPAALRVRVPR